MTNASSPIIVLSWILSLSPVSINDIKQKEIDEDLLLAFECEIIPLRCTLEPVVAKKR